MKKDQPAARLVPVGDADSRRGRPPVGTVTSDPVVLSADAFAPLTDDELEPCCLFKHIDHIALV